MTIIHITTSDGEFIRCLSWQEVYRYVDGKVDKEMAESEHKRVEELLANEELPV